MNSNLYPLLFTPVYKDYIWGGHRIPEVFDRDIEQDLIAESWEVSDRPEGMSIVRNGSLAGTPLQELVASAGKDLLGSACDAESFPLLIKIIDAKQRLSVQVHPDDDSADIHGGEAKTEMWYALGGSPGAQVFAGLAAGTTAESFRSALEAEELEASLNALPLAAGEAIYIPGGRVHAIAEGCLLLEVQQNSNTTYRVYDWGRLGHDGTPRELHIEQAFKVINWEDAAPSVIKPKKKDNVDGSSSSEIVHSPYFHLTRWDLTQDLAVTHSGESFHVLFTLSGDVTLEANGTIETLTPGTACLVPACIKDYRVSPVTETASHIRITL